MNGTTVMPLLIVALIIWAGVFAFILGVEGRIRKLERRVTDAQRDADNVTAASLAAQKELGR